MRLRRRLGDGSIFEEIFTQRSFEISYELADDLGLGHAERSGGGIANRFEFRMVMGLWTSGLRRSVLNGRRGFMGDGSWEETIAQGRLKI
jgi:hypothetical protein